MFKTFKMGMAIAKSSLEVGIDLSKFSSDRRVSIISLLQNGIIATAEEGAGIHFWQKYRYMDERNFQNEKYEMEQFFPVLEQWEDLGCAGISSFYNLAKNLALDSDFRKLVEEETKRQQG